MNIGAGKCELLNTIECKTNKSNLPISKFIIYLYFMIPEILRPFAGQSLVIGVKK